ncbi:glutathione S-transferase C-terminal domain-containing protein [Caulobacter sp. RL271]|uniref:Glutathione S-transferase C-terminal domain-containing protein n=2 Tax=Caulobacter TaxID=75 RepID=A0ABY5A0R1_9CAUL|nr:glutathione binding-like protein [Caulobacter segnis]USQ98498.1 glutathione S-transferase C-terminal domain-containing protein [Caulobacter segnis]
MLRRCTPTRRTRSFARCKFRRIRPQWLSRQQARHAIAVDEGGVLRKRQFVAGDAFSMADITVIGGLIFAELVELPVPSDCEALLAWHQRMQERPSVRNRVTMSDPAHVSA